MKIFPGDEVRFLNEIGGGIVKKVLSKNMALILTNDDFEYSVPINELVVIKSAESNHNNSPKTESFIHEETKEIKNKEEEAPVLKDNNNVEILVAFTKENSGEDDIFDCLLLNDSNHYLFLNAISRGNNGLQKIESDSLEPNTIIKLGSFSRDEINSISEIIIQILFYGNKYDLLKQPIERRIKIEPVKFYNEGTFKENDLLDENAYIFLIYKEEGGLGNSVKSQEDFNRIILEKESAAPSVKQSKPHKKQEQVEVDLHINALIDSVVGLKNHEILKIQMDKFHTELTKAIQNNVGKIVFIHGIGNGTLKSSLRESLSTQYKLHYEDASFREYGFGATLVIL